MGDETIDRRGGISEPENTVDPPANREGECENPSISAPPPETVVVIRSDPGIGGEIGDTKADGIPNAAVNVLLRSSLVVEKNTQDAKDHDDTHSHCVIDVKSDGNGKLEENLDGETVCRICHLTSDPSNATPPRTTTTTAAAATVSATTRTSLIQLGCDCKAELGVVHSHCAEAWFKLKGNRRCEICGESAKNVTGVADNGFIEGWNETRPPAGSITNLSERRRGCFRGRPFCNFLMACLVIAFVLPWFFRVQMF